MLIDSHCHLQFPQYNNDREKVIKSALGAKVQMICIGTDLVTSQKAIGIANRYDEVWAAVGLHPNDLPENFDITDYEKLLDNEKVVAIGEVGLDYYRTPQPEKQEKQKEIFKQFANLAKETNLPLIIHCRDAYSDMIKILASRYQIPNTVRTGVIHSFAGALEEAREYIDLGFYIGLNGIITFSNQYDKMVVNLPLDKILLETDAPYLAPPPHRGKRNEPLYVKYVAEKIAEIKKISAEEIIKITVQNTKKLFNLNV